MSVKIYVAWRCKKSYGIFNLVRDLMHASRGQVEKRLKQIVEKTRLQDNYRARMELGYMLARHIRHGAFSLERDPYDYNQTFFIREAGDYFLIVPCDGRDKYERVDALESLETYGYWNNTDPPDDVTEEEWNERGDFWDRYWEPKNPVVECHALDIRDPFMEIAEILLPEYLQHDGKVPEDWWEVPK